EAVQRPDRGEQHPEADVDEIDARDGQRDVADQYDALVQNAVDELHKRHVLLQRRRPVAHDASGSTKLYGGQGPVSWNSTPSAAYEDWSAERAARNASSQRSSTR